MKAFDSNRKKQVWHWNRLPVRKCKTPRSYQTAHATAKHFYIFFTSNTHPSPGFFSRSVAMFTKVAGLDLRHTTLCQLCTRVVRNPLVNYFSFGHLFVWQNDLGEGAFYRLLPDLGGWAFLGRWEIELLQCEPASSTSLSVQWVIRWVVELPQAYQRLGKWSLRWDAQLERTPLFFMPQNPMRKQSGKQGIRKYRTLLSKSNPSIQAIFLSTWEALQLDIQTHSRQPMSLCIPGFIRRFWDVTRAGIQACLCTSRIQTISGWWFQPLWKVLVSWDDYSQNMEK